MAKVKLVMTRPDLVKTSSILMCPIAKASEWMFVVLEINLMLALKKLWSTSHTLQSALKISHSNFSRKLKLKPDMIGVYLKVCSDKVCTSDTTNCNNSLTKSLKVPCFIIQSGFSHTITIWFSLLQRRPQFKSKFTFLFNIFPQDSYYFLLRDKKKKITATT